MSYNLCIRLFRKTIKFIAGIIFTAICGWCCLAILIDGPAKPYSYILLGLFIAVQFLSIFIISPRKFGYIISVLSISTVMFAWLNIPASNNRDWTADVARTPEVVFDGDLVTIKNVRNFDYRSETDFTENWEERKYDLSKVTGRDMYLSYWGPKWMAHTISSWEFSDGRHLAISIETRKEVGEEYSALLGFFRQFELYYVVADERDVIRLRSNYRNEDVYLYHLNETPEVAAALLKEYLKEVNNLKQNAKWYNALTTNCTSVIRKMRKNVTQVLSWNWRMLLNGYLDEFGYTNGAVDTTLPFEQYKQQCLITQRAKDADQDLDFSKLIRRH